MRILSTQLLMKKQFNKPDLAWEELHGNNMQ